MKGQSAIEFLTTYVWVFIIIAIFIAVVSSIALSSSPNTFIPSSCFIEPELPCPVAALFTNSVTGNALYTVIFINKLGTWMTFPQNALNITPISRNVGSSFGQCFPANAPAGALIECNATIPSYSPGTGTQLSQIFTLGYSICTPSPCAKPIYNTTGYSSLTAQAYVPYIKLATLQIAGGACTMPANSGYIAAGGVRYLSGNLIPFINDQKVQLQFISSGTNTLSSWSASSANVAFSNTISNPTNVTVPANIVGSLSITANCN